MDYSIYSIVGETKTMLNGQMCEVIEDNGAYDITVKFEDGTIVAHKARSSFKKGKIGNPNIVRGSILGQTNLMNCGMECTVIKDIAYRDITVQFVDGTIVSHQDRQSFRKGYINNPSLGTRHERDLEHHKIVGETRTMHCGMKCTVIEDNGANDITVQFEDGYIHKHRSRDDFRKMRIANLKLGSKYANKASILGQSNMMTCGMKCTVIEDNSYKDIVVEFEDGYITRTRRDAFKNGNIRNPNYPRGSILGESRVMLCGMSCKVIKDLGDDRITVMFEDGYIRDNCSRGNFKSGKISNPFVESSFPQSYIFYNIRKYFPDAKYNYRPSWLKPVGGVPYEIDIWIPSLSKGIEYDGAAYHSKETHKSQEKSKLIVQAREIKELITVLEKGSVIHTSRKHTNYQLDYSTDYYEYGYLITQLYYVVEKILKSFGIDNPQIETDRKKIQRYKVLNCH